MEKTTYLFDLYSRNSFNTFKETTKKDNTLYMIDTKYYLYNGVLTFTKSFNMQTNFYKYRTTVATISRDISENGHIRIARVNNINNSYSNVFNLRG